MDKEEVVKIGRRRCSRPPPRGERNGPGHLVVGRTMNKAGGAYPQRNMETGPKYVDNLEAMPMSLYRRGASSNKYQEDCLCSNLYVGPGGLGKRDPPPPGSPVAPGSARNSRNNSPSRKGAPPQKRHPSAESRSYFELHAKPHENKRGYSQSDNLDLDLCVTDGAVEKEKSVRGRSPSRRKYMYSQGDIKRCFIDNLGAGEDGGDDAGKENAPPLRKQTPPPMTDRKPYKPMRKPVAAPALPCRDDLLSKGAEKPVPVKAQVCRLPAGTMPPSCDVVGHHTVRKRFNPEADLETRAPVAGWTPSPARNRGCMTPPVQPEPTGVPGHTRRAATPPRRRNNPITGGVFGVAGGGESGAQTARNTNASNLRESSAPRKRALSPLKNISKPGLLDWVF